MELTFVYEGIVLGEHQWSCEYGSTTAFEHDGDKFMTAVVAQVKAVFPMLLPAHVTLERNTSRSYELDDAGEVVVAIGYDHAKAIVFIKVNEIPAPMVPLLAAQFST